MKELIEKLKNYIAYLLKIGRYDDNTAQWMINFESEIAVLEAKLKEEQCHNIYKKVKDAWTVGSKEQPESLNNIFLIHRDGNKTRLYKNGKKISPEEFTQFYECEMTDEQKEILKIAQENYFESLEQSGQTAKETFCKDSYIKKGDDLFKFASQRQSELTDKEIEKQAFKEYKHSKSDYGGSISRVAFKKGAKWARDRK